MKLQRFFLLFSVFSISALYSGCNDKKDATVYSVAKETPPPAPASAPSQAAEMPAALPPGHPGMGATPGALPPGHPAMGGTAGALPPGHPSMGGMAPKMDTDNQPSPEISAGTPPPQWKMKAPTQMRLASFEVKGDKETSADISLVLLGGPAGGILENINRWQAQLGQPGFTAENLAQNSQTLDTPLGKATVVDLQGLPQGANAAMDGRIVGAIIPVKDTTLFFKMRGNAELVGAQKADFLQWIATVRPAEAKATPGGKCPVPHDPAPASAPATNAPEPSAPAPSPEPAK